MVRLPYRGSEERFQSQHMGRRRELSSERMLASIQDQGARLRALLRWQVRAVSGRSLLY